MSTIHFKPGMDVYLPFWILFDSPPVTPFVKCRVINIEWQSFQNQNDVGIVAGLVCDLDLGKNGFANSIPVSCLIAKEELHDCAEKIAKWFLDFAQA